MSLITILGDVHLAKNLSQGKPGIGANLNSRISDQLNLLDWTLEQAVESGSDNIVITGDIFEDPKPHPSIITLFMAWIKKCQAFNVKIHIIAGNHDILRNGFIYTSPLDIISEAELDGVFIYKDINTIHIGSTALTLIPFRDRKSYGTSSATEALSLLKDSLVYELASVPVTYNKILIGHLAIEGSIPIGDEIDDVTNELFCPISMFQGYDYVWMGHVHKPQVMNKKNPYIAHIGSMDISNFSENDHKKCIIFYDCDNNNFETKYLPTRPLKKVSITIPKDTEDSTEYVIKELEKEKDWERSIAKIEIVLSSPELKSINKSVIDKYLISQGTFNITGISETKKVSFIKKDINNTINTKMDINLAIKTYAHTYVDEKMRPEFISLINEIYNEYLIGEKD